MVRYRHGFSLVELLVVTAMMAVLLAILLPALDKARDSAKKVACQARLRQDILGTVTFATDHRGRLMNRGYTLYPHCTERITGSLLSSDANPDAKYPLNQWVTQYLSIPRGKALFCAGALADDPKRSPSSGEYAYRYMTYQYLGDLDTPARLQICLWTPGATIHKPSMNAGGDIPVWACASLELVSSGTWLGHDALNARVKFTGQNSAQLDGSVAWAPWQQLEEYGYWPGSLGFYRRKTN